MQKLETKHIVGLVVGSLLLSLACGAESTTPFFYFFGVFVSSLVLISSLFLPRRFVIYPVFILIINMLDLTQVAEDELEYGQVLTASPWQFRIGPIVPAAIVFLFLLIVGIRLYKPKRQTSYKIFFIYFLLFSTLVSLWFGYFQEDIARFITDFKVPLFFGAGLIIFSSYYERYPDSLKVSSQVFMCLLAGHFLLDFLYLLLGVSISMVSGFKNVSVDSGKGLLAVLIFFALANILNRNRSTPAMIIVNVLLAIASFYLLLSYQTRWLVVTLAVGLLVMLPLLLGSRRVLKLYVPVLLLATISLPILIQLRPDAWEVTKLRFSFVEKLGMGSSLEDADTARAASIYNAMGLLTDKRAFLTGLGYGSWWDGRYYPLPALTVSAFDLGALNAGRYYRVHDFTFHFLFKVGIIGLGVYAFIFLRPLWAIWKIRKRVREDDMQRTIAIILFGMVALVATNMWFTGKGLLFSAMFVCASQAWANTFEKAPSLEPVPKPMRRAAYRNPAIGYANSV